MSEAPSEVTQAESVDSNPEQQKPGRLWVMWVILALVIYVLSIGPAIRLAAPKPRSQQAFLVVYAPLSFVADYCPPIRSFLQWYVDLWMPSCFGGFPGGW
jgi:hypothetical protein